MNEPLVRVHGLWKVFGEGETRVEAVRDVEMELARGEIVLVMGPSGSGKTTLLSMLGGLLRPTDGEIWVDGVDIAKLSEHELPRFRAHRFGFIFQDFNLLAALSAEENVEVALNLAGSRGTAADARARQLLDELGLGGRLDFAADQLSGGEKQRVAVARAIANRPQLILADEPTANLDSQRGHETMRLLRRLANEHEATVLIVSHDERLRVVADRVLWLEDGRFKELAALERDPVCGMLVEPERAVSLQWEGGTLYFCAAGCRDQFRWEHAEAADTLKGYIREGSPTMSELVYTVPDMNCSHCKQAVSSELSQVAGVDSVDVDLDTKLVTVRGHELDDAALRAAIEEAGNEAN
jgi:putative ABC transport system ATP-binding protein